jgi:hypothetical protein
MYLYGGTMGASMEIYGAQTNLPAAQNFECPSHSHPVHGWLDPNVSNCGHTHPQQLSD